MRVGDGYSRSSDADCLVIADEVNFAFLGKRSLDGSGMGARRRVRVDSFDSDGASKKCAARTMLISVIC